MGYVIRQGQQIEVEVINPSPHEQVAPNGNVADGYLPQFKSKWPGGAAVPRPRRPRLIGASFTFLADVCRLTEGRAPLVVAMLIYRRTCVCDSRTVTVPGAELAELGITRPQKYKALAKLAAAGIIQIEPGKAGRTARVTVAWRKR